MLADPESGLSLFKQAVLVSYLDALEAANADAQAAAERQTYVVDLLLAASMVLLPWAPPVPAAIISVAQHAMAIDGALSFVRAAAHLDSDFRELVRQEFLGPRQVMLDDMAGLGRTLAAAPGWEEEALLLLRAGLSVRQTALALTLFPTRRLIF
jgi:hypothetical protein